MAKRFSPRRRKPPTILVNMHAYPPLFGLKMGKHIFAYAARLKWDGDLQWYEINKACYVGKYTPNDLWTPAKHGVVDDRSQSPLIPKGMDYYFRD